MRAHSNIWLWILFMNSPFKYVGCTLRWQFDLLCDVRCWAKDCWYTARSTVRHWNDRPRCVFQVWEYATKWRENTWTWNTEKSIQISKLQFDKTYISESGVFSARWLLKCLPCLNQWSNWLDFSCSLEVANKVELKNWKLFLTFPQLMNTTGLTKNWYSY